MKRNVIENCIVTENCVFPIRDLGYDYVVFDNIINTHSLVYEQYGITQLMKIDFEGYLKKVLNPYFKYYFDENIKEIMIDKEILKKFEMESRMIECQMILSNLDNKKLKYTVIFNNSHYSFNKKQFDELSEKLIKQTVNYYTQKSNKYNYLKRFKYVFGYVLKKLNNPCYNCKHKKFNDEFDLIKYINNLKD